MTIKIYEKGKQERLSTHFTVSEFACHGTDCCHQVKIDDALVAYLEKIRAHFDRPVLITSGYRCPVYDAAIGGAQFTAALTQFQRDHDCAPTGVAEQWDSTWHQLLQAQWGV